MLPRIAGLLFLVVIMNCYGAPYVKVNGDYGAECPPDVHGARAHLETFLFEREHSNPVIREIAEDVAAPENLEVLQDSTHSEICRYFNDIYHDALTERREVKGEAMGPHRYAVVYYRTDNYYFTFVLEILEPAARGDSEESSRTLRPMSMGILDSDLNGLRTLML